jgi:hypothetical protein
VHESRVRNGIHNRKGGIHTCQFSTPRPGPTLWENLYLTGPLAIPLVPSLKIKRLHVHSADALNSRSGVEVEVFYFLLLAIFL